MDAELNKIDVEPAAKTADTQEKKSSKSAVSDTVETAGSLYDSFISWHLS